MKIRAVIDRNGYAAICEQCALFFRSPNAMRECESRGEKADTVKKRQCPFRIGSFTPRSLVTCFEKVHVNSATSTERSVRHGFEEFCGLLSGNVDYYTKRENNGQLDWYENTTPKEEKRYSTDVIADEMQMLGSRGGGGEGGFSGGMGGGGERRERGPARGPQPAPAARNVPAAAPSSGGGGGFDDDEIPF